MASTYVYIRENSIEWNEPNIMMKSGVCCGIDPCFVKVKDHIKVLDFDDDLFTNMSDDLPYCFECRTCLFGGQGEKVNLLGPSCCFGICLRAECAFPMFLPVCCPKFCCPCLLREEIYVEDSQRALFEIKKLREYAYSKEKQVWTSNQEKNRV
jgi:hypothetical protein